MKNISQHHTHPIKHKKQNGRETARVAINDFINDMLKQKIQIFVIVHGVGEGIIRNTTLEALRKNKNVLEFKGFYYNTGCTLVRIKI